MTAWPVTPIEDLCSVVVDCINKTAPTVDGPTPFKMIRTTNVRDARVDTSNVRYVAEETYRKWTRRGTPLSGDVILTREAPLGDVGLLRGSDTVFLGQRLVMYRADPTKADNRFLLYALLSPSVQGAIRGLGSGATVEHLRVRDCETIPLPTPPLPIQRKIAAVLAAYDELIENNLRRIEILEEMAQALYREWFVEFRFPGHEDAEMVDSELGPIPEDWCWDCFRTLADEIKEGVSPEDIDPDTPYVGLEHVPRRSFTITETGVARDVGSRKWRFEPGDVLFGRLRPYFHKVALASDAGVCSTDVIVIRPRAHRHELALQVAFSEDFVGHAVATSGGTDRPRAKWSDLAEFAVAIPPDPLLRRFTETVRPMLRLTQILAHQNANLRATRDLLLPKLVSGEIDVSDLNIDTDWLVA